MWLSFVTFDMGFPKIQSKIFFNFEMIDLESLLFQFISNF